jgi:hypothetical protein
MGSVTVIFNAVNFFIMRILIACMAQIAGFGVDLFVNIGIVEGVSCVGGISASAGSFVNILAICLIVKGMRFCYRITASTSHGVTVAILGHNGRVVMLLPNGNAATGAVLFVAVRIVSGFCKGVIVVFQAIKGNPCISSLGLGITTTITAMFEQSRPCPF